MKLLPIEQSDEWMSVLRRSYQYDWYHLPHSHVMAEKRGEGTGRLFVYSEGNDFIAVPLLLRSLDDIPGVGRHAVGWKDATSVYGYAGPVSSRPVLPPPVVQGFQSSLREALQRMSVVTVFSRLHPLIPQRSILAGCGECLSMGQTVSIDLALPEYLQPKQFRKGHKYDLKAARNAGLICVEDTNGSFLDRFCEIYTATMRRVSASSRYFFGPEYFTDLISGLGSSARLFVVLSEETVICGGLFVFCDGIVQYFLGGSLDEFHKLAPTKLLIDSVREQARSEGYKVLHLGGGVGAHADSLFYFKAGFSERRHEFLTWQFVVQPEIYQQFCEQHEQYKTVEGATESEPVFFPKYRCPITSHCETKLSKSTAL